MFYDKGTIVSVQPETSHTHLLNLCVYIHVCVSARVCLRERERERE